MKSSKSDWVYRIIKILQIIRPFLSSEYKKSVDNALHIFKYGKGWLTDDLVVKIFFFEDFYDSNAGKSCK